MMERWFGIIDKLDFWLMLEQLEFSKITQSAPIKLAELKDHLAN